MPSLFGMARQAPGWQGVRGSVSCLLYSKSATNSPSLQHIQSTPCREEVGGGLSLVISVTCCNTPSGHGPVATRPIFNKEQVTRVPWILGYSMLPRMSLFHGNPPPFSQGSKHLSQGLFPSVPMWSSQALLIVEGGGGWGTERRVGTHSQFKGLIKEWVKFLLMLLSLPGGQLREFMSGFQRQLNKGVTGTWQVAHRGAAD